MVIVIFEGNKLICLNAGDSRACKVSVKHQSYGPTTCEAFPLTIDHKPEVELERARIVQAGGRI